MRMLLSTTAAVFALAACATTEPTAPAALTAAAPAAAAPAAPTAATPPAANTLPFARVNDLGQGISMLIGAGGNLGLSVGADGVFLIDDQFATNAVANLAKVEELAKGKPKYLINTHYHGDHAGGNAVFAGAGAMVFASDNVRKRLTGETVTTGRFAPVSLPPKVAWPVVTFTSGIDFHLNGQTIRAIRAPMPAHTDGDTFVYFVEADVLHTGDVYTKDRYPTVDVGAGGNQAGFIAGLERLLQIAGPNTKIIPGHGELAAKADMQATFDMHKGARAAVEAQVKAGKTLEQTIAAKPLAQWTPRFGTQAGSDDTYVTIIYNELKK
ncbi:MAG: MBL fold metallo-hydrolase [Hyphomonadaceae bacterium]